jgi:alpha-ketoglutarate-dependent taurine dioxygenase
MKISKIPNLGRFGIFIDDVDFNNISSDEWMEIGQLHLNHLVTIIRNTNLEPTSFHPFIQKWGDPRSIQTLKIMKKYQKSFSRLVEDARVNADYLSEEDKSWIRILVLNLVVRDAEGHMTPVVKVTGKKNEKGEPLGLFADGELLWHSNESGNLTFTPGVALFAHDGVIGSATGFCTTTDWYESQTESFRSELDEMIILHKFTPGRINPGLRADQDFILHKNMCPEDNIKIPLVIESPGGIRGLHFSVNTIDKIDGMTEEESNRVLQRISNELFTEQYIYDHWYANHNDLCLFDNSITLHRRLGGITNRMCYRIQHDYKYIEPKMYQPYIQKEYQDLYLEEYNSIKRTDYID